MCRCNRMKVTCKMQVHFFHRHDLRIATSSGATLHTKARTKRCLTDTDHGLFTNGIKTIAKANCSGGFTFTSRGRVNCRNQNQLAITAASFGGYEFSRYFGFIMTKGQKILFRNVELFTNLLDWLHLCFTCNFDIAFISHQVSHLLIIVASLRQ